MKSQDHPSSPLWTPGDAAWGKVAAAYRDGQSGQDLEEMAAPYGFAQRVVAQAGARRRQERLTWWSRWSLRAAAGALMVAALVALRSPSLESGTCLLEVPALEIPGLSSL